MRIFKSLYFYVIVAIITGILLGVYAKDFALELKPLADGFIKLIKMMIAPIIFCTIVTGIAGMSDLKQAGRVGIKSLVYFEIVTTIALLLGLLVVNIVKPGAGMHIDIATLDASAVSTYVKQAGEQNFTDFLLHIIPDTLLSAFSEGNLLQVLFTGILVGAALATIRTKALPVINALHILQDAFFVIMKFIMKLAPLGALGAMAYTVAKYGAESLTALGKLMLCFYATCLMFVFLILGMVLKYCGYNIFKLVKFIGEELLIVLGTSSSESALPALMQKMKKAGCDESLVNLVVPTGYSFNLDGTSIYLTMAAIFITQALDIPISFSQQLYLLLIMLLTSKGAAGVTGAGFITLAATLPLVEHIPAASVVLVLGIDKFMSEARALTNITGNAVAVVVIAKWEKKIDAKTASHYLR